MAGGGISLTFDTSGLKAAIDAFEENAIQTGEATRAASRKTARQIRRDVSRDVQAKIGITSAAMRRRFRIFDAYDRQTGAWSVRAWFGTRPISPFEAGAHRSGVGVATKSERWPHAFIVQMRGKTTVVQRYGPKRMIQGRLRQPLETLTVKIHDHVKAALDRAMPRAQATYRAEFVDRLRSQIARGGG